jgi:MFS transporter, SET family, sugar efflux transporter
VKFAEDTRPGVADSSLRSRLFGRTTLSLGVATGFFGITESVFGTTTSLFLANAVRVGPLLIGLYFTGCAIAGIGVNLAAGWLSDRLTDRRVALALTGLAGATGALIFIVVRNYAVVFLTGAVLFSLNGAYLSQLFAYVKEFAESTGREVTAFSSAVRSIFSAGWIIGPPAGFFLLAHLGFGLMYTCAAGLLLTTALLGRWFLPALHLSPRTADPDTGNGNQLGLRRILATVPRRTWLLLGSVTAVYVADQMYLIVIALYVTKNLHLSPSLVGLMAGICAALEIPLMITVGRLAERIGKLRVVAAAMVLAAVFFCLLPLAGSTPVLIALQLPNAMWTAAIMSIPMVIVQEEVPGGSGTASSLYSSTFPLAQLLAGAITGVVAAQAGYRNVFWICAGLCALATALLLWRMAFHPGDRGTSAREAAAA